MTMDLDLCPWCGGPADFECLENGRFSVGCHDSEGECLGFQLMTTFATKREAREAWNNRAALASHPAASDGEGGKYRLMLLELLAVIHRDGGHKVQEIGIKLAYEQALQLSSKRIAALTAKQSPADMNGAEALARRFHSAYERLAPDFGYETRPETKDFDPASRNGRLMVAVCAEIMSTPEGAEEVIARKLCELAGHDPDGGPKIGFGWIDYRDDARAILSLLQEKGNG